MIGGAARLLAIAALVAGGCTANGSTPQVVDRAPPSPRLAPPRPGVLPRLRPGVTMPAWQRVATRNDVMRLAGWRDAFVAGLASARRTGATAAIAREGALLDPDAALVHPSLPAGDYTCRIIKLGSQRTDMLSYVDYPAFACRVTEEGEVDSFRKLTGSQRPQGLLFHDVPTRDVFLGTLILGDETHALDYGRDPQRDMVGAVERIGARRWRMLLPYPRFESLIDVVELVSAT